MWGAGPGEGSGAIRQTTATALPAGHCRQVDRLRAWAVLLVMGLGAPVRGIDGGFVGMDVFFVISGFLVTGIIFDQHTPGQRGDRRGRTRQPRDGSRQRAVRSQGRFFRDHGAGVGTAARRAGCILRLPTQPRTL